ncbi:hypothetical protein GGR56DRAFT_660801 [Xylariaceae sp. FL0804]|nr:hypothetical protein GGR56DRAFT_660801 [Xylariaceae sp. FL0804]
MSLAGSNSRFSPREVAPPPPVLEGHRNGPPAGTLFSASQALREKVDEETQEEDAETIAAGVARDADAVSILSTTSIADPHGRKRLYISDARTKTVYEAWEIVSRCDTMELHTWRSLCGIKVSRRWVSRVDGFVEAKPLVAFEQGELAAMHVHALREYEALGGKGKKGESYDQNLANRTSRLPAEIYNNLEGLVNDRTQASNVSPYRRREWRVVVLEEGEVQLTELLPQRKKRGLFRREPEEPRTRRQLVVLRGEEIKTTKQERGWGMFENDTNPWRKLDKEETRASRRHAVAFLDRLDREDARKALEKEEAKRADARSARPLLSQSRRPEPADWDIFVDQPAGAQGGRSEKSDQ